MGGVKRVRNEREVGVLTVLKGMKAGEIGGNYVTML